MSEKAELSVPEIVEKLFEGSEVRVPLGLFTGSTAVEAFLSHVRTTKSRTVKKFRAVGFEFCGDQMSLSVAHDPVTDSMTLKLVPPKVPKYTVIVTPAEE